jgi:outer membrane receptor for ferrienterochelin and colicins
MPHFLKHRYMAPVSGAVFFLLASSSRAEEIVLPEIKVNARQSTELRRNSSTGKLVYDREELDAMDAANIGDLLRRLPGTGVFTDPDSRRGKGKGRDRYMPQILVDGQPLPGGDKSPATALRLPVELIERIEIIRNSTAEFPVTGPGGVINLILRDVPPRATKSSRLTLGSAEGEPLLRAEGQYGERLDNFGYLLGISLQSQPLIGHQTTGIEQFTGGNLSSQTQEKIEQSGRENNLALTPRFNWQLGNGESFSVTPLISLNEKEQKSLVHRSTRNNPGNSSVWQDAGYDNEQNNGRRGSGRLNAEWKQAQTAGGELLARATVQGEFEEIDKAIYKYNSAGISTGNTSENTRHYEREASMMLKGKRLFADNHFVTGALEWRGKTSTDSQEKTSNGLALAGGADSRAEITDRRQIIWMQDEWQLADEHLLTPGLRWQQQKSTVTDGAGAVIESSFRSFDPALHYLWQVSPDWNIRSSIARNGKPPNPKDLSPVIRSSNSTNTSTNPDKAGNPNLAPEQSLSLEIGAEHFLAERAGTIGFSVFHRQIADQVQKLVQYENGRWVERPYNVGDAELRGGLLDFKWRTDQLNLPDLTLRGNLSYTTTKITNLTPGLGAGEGPRKAANLGFDYAVSRWQTTLGGNFNYIGELDRESSASVRQTQGQRRQLDLYALYRIDRQLSLRFSAQNILRQERHGEVVEYDNNGQLNRTENDRESGIATYLLSLEGKW